MENFNTKAALNVAAFTVAIVVCILAGYAVQHGMEVIIGETITPTQSLGTVVIGRIFTCVLAVGVLITAIRKF